MIRLVSGRRCRGFDAVDQDRYEERKDAVSLIPATISQDPEMELFRHRFDPQVQL
jgi:hypothetical protein